ncbi:hypothetical protein K492DRAFT_172497 [Lichtheimia hyalospora FSU 10163]|nr:hypothetical protein K492DRAFT_172497 [Lichtheimia hyalospora FSU 10163]
MDGKKNITDLKRQFKRLIKNPFHRRRRRKDKAPAVEKEVPSSSSSYSSQQQQPSTPLHPRRIATRILGLHNKLWRRQQTVAVCGCGRPLKAGWNCSNCRLVCPNCQRALSDGEKCSRCYPPSFEEPISCGVIEASSSAAEQMPTSGMNDSKNQQQH